jgi:hypothetical protein
VIDGFTGIQRLLLSWAQIWQQKGREAETIRLLTIDPHSPNEFRCNQIVRNVDEFYRAFDVTETDASGSTPTSASPSGERDARRPGGRRRPVGDRRRRARTRRGAAHAADASTAHPPRRRHSRRWRDAPSLRARAHRCGGGRRSALTARCRDRLPRRAFAFVPRHARGARRLAAAGRRCRCASRLGSGGRCSRATLLLPVAGSASCRC